MAKYAFGASRWHTLAQPTPGGYGQFARCGAAVFRSPLMTKQQRFFSDALVAPEPQCATCASVGLVIPVSQIIDQDLRRVALIALDMGRKVVVKKDVV
jgi:hypothetical protein